MTNRGIMLLKNMQGKSYNEKEQIAKEIINVEYEKIIAQAKNFCKCYSEDELANKVLSTKNSDELFTYLDKLSVIEISILSSYGIDVSFMNLLKVSE